MLLLNRRLDILVHPQKGFGVVFPEESVHIFRYLIHIYILRYNSVVNKGIILT